MENNPLPTPVVPSQEEVNRRMAEWYQAMELSHAMLMSGLRRKVGPDGDINAAYREWYRDHEDRKWNEIFKIQEQRERQRAESRGCNTLNSTDGELL